MEVNVSNSSVSPYLSRPRKGPVLLSVALVFYVIGIFGNFLALVILARKKNTKNGKYTLMLRCLVANDLIALFGMFTQMSTEYLFAEHISEIYQVFCVGRVICRFFGLSSGCIATVMAAERWMALARPFTYHKHITYSVIMKTIVFLVVIAAVVTFLPFVGFGIYHNPETRVCARYREATTISGISYAYLFMVFGSLLCVMIVVCNLFVTRVLYIIGQRKTCHRKTIQYDFVNGEKGVVLVHQTSFPNTSSDEIRFAKLMTFLSISFVVCWMPQMIAVPLALMPNPLRNTHWFFKVADILMALHFTSDPYIYVLTRIKLSNILNYCRSCRRRGMHRSQSVQSSKLRPTMEQTLDDGLNT